MIQQSEQFGLRVAFYYVAYFVILGVYIPVFPVWLDDRLTTSADLSLVLAAPIVAKILFSSPMAVYADRAGDRRRALILSGVLSCILFPVLWLLDGVFLLFAGLFLVSIFWQTSLPLIDASAALGARLRGLDYGRIRLWGSLGFIAGTFGAGLLLAEGAQLVFFALAGMFLCLVAGAVGLPDLKRDVQEADATGASPDALKGRPNGTAWVTAPLIIVICSAALAQASHAGLYAFATLHWQALGFRGFEIGLLWSVGVIAEILLFYVSKTFRRINPVTLIAIGAGLGMLRWLAFPGVSDFGPMLGLQLLHAASFGAVHLGIVGFIASEVRARRAGSAQGLFSSVSGLVMAISTLGAGLAYDLSVDLLFNAMAGLSALGLFSLLLLQLPFRRKPGPPSTP